jgi:hypothetical protein
VAAAALAVQLIKRHPISIHLHKSRRDDLDTNVLSWLTNPVPSIPVSYSALSDFDIDNSSSPELHPSSRVWPNDLASLEVVTLQESSVRSEWMELSDWGSQCCT